MKIFICIDDTDDVEKGRGTGTLAEEISVKIEEKKLGVCSRVTRHQLLLHEDIPYTSHNSSMCFEAIINEKDLQKIILFASTYLEKEHAKGSDPGLCIVSVDKLSKENKRLLMEFGINAKKYVLTKEDGYKCAKEINVHLSEHGGDGQGIIGALAGAGLRLTGDDGEFKGALKFAKDKETFTVGEILCNKEVDLVINTDKKILKDTDKIIFGKKIKTILFQGKSALVVIKKGENYKTCNKKELREFEDERI